jgi:predicted metal-dependent enzyme (double-stranded beta helix superfamily)
MLDLQGLDVPQPVDDLQNALNDACRHDVLSSEFGSSVRSALGALLLNADHRPLLAELRRHGNADTYKRHLLYADPLGRYAIAALVWQPGQFSPVHAHHTWCSYAVVEGALSETLFSWNAQAHRAETTRNVERRRGAISFVSGGRCAIHRLGNPEGNNSVAISIHIYGVAGEQIATHVNDLVAAA